MAGASLDAGSASAVAAARACYRLPYFQAHMAIEREADERRYSSQRKAKGWISPLRGPTVAAPGRRG